MLFELKIEVSTSSTVDGRGSSFVVNLRCYLGVFLVLLGFLRAIIDGVWPNLEADDRIWHQFEDEVDNEDRQCKDNCLKLLFPRQSICVQVEELSGPLDESQLHEHNEGPHQEEWKVAADTGKDIEFIVNLPRADHVPDLQEHEEMEDPSHVAGVFICLILDSLVDRITT